MNQKKKSLPKGKSPYTVVEVLQMFDLAKKQSDDGKGNINSLKFWRAVEKKNLIPDRSAQSLKTAHRKFCHSLTPD